jgi:alpha-tubulin suppressor-like RCC1 family protein
VYCWGENSDGEVGDGTLTNRLAPVRLNALPPGVTTVATGYFHTCAVTTGGTYCWGFNGIGELGNGTSSSTPVLTPVLVNGNLDFRSLSLGHQSSCGVTTSGAAYCWGSNEWGELGIGNFNWPAQPVALPGGSTWTDVQIGLVHACGVTTGGAALCWGRLRYGELGIGITGMVLSPAPVQGGIVFDEEPCLQVGCAVTGPSLRTSSRFTRGLAGTYHSRPLPRVEPIRPAECADPARGCTLPPVRLVR